MLHDLLIENTTVERINRYLSLPVDTSIPNVERRVFWVKEGDIPEELDRRVHIVRPCDVLGWFFSNGYPVPREREDLSENTLAQLMDESARTYRELKKAREYPMVVLIITSRYTSVLQYVSSDLCEALRNAGVKTVLRFIETEIEYALAVQRHRPDAVICLDHIRGEQGHYDNVHPHIKFISWIQDEMSQIKDPRNIERCMPHDITYAISAMMPSHTGLGLPNLKLLDFAVNPRHFPNRYTGEHSGKIAFITNLLPVKARTRLEHEVKNIIDAQGVHITSFHDAKELLLDSGREGLVDNPELLRWITLYTRRANRLALIDVLRDNGFSLALYGSGLEDDPDYLGTISPQDKESLGRAYAEHAAVIHYNPGANLHPRVLEATLSGGLVIAGKDNTPDFPLVQFSDHDEMLDLCARAVSDEQWRKESIDKLSLVVSMSHTYERRAAQICKDLGRK